MTREDRLAELLEIWEDTMTHGRTATPEDLCRDCPDLLDDFRQLLNQLGAVNAAIVKLRPTTLAGFVAKAKRAHKARAGDERRPDECMDGMLVTSLITDLAAMEV